MIEKAFDARGESEPVEPARRGSDRKIDVGIAVRGKIGSAHEPPVA